MALPVSIGDIITILSLAKTTLNRIKSAPQDFQDTKKNVRGLVAVLQSLQTEIEKPTSALHRDTALVERLGLVIGPCRTSLQRLNRILRRYASLGSDNARFSDRMAFPKSAVSDIQRDLSSRYTELSTLLGTATIGSTGRIESSLDKVANSTDRLSTGVEAISIQQTRILDAVEKVAGAIGDRQDARSIMSDHSNDNKVVWRQLRRDLNQAGFKSADIEKHKRLIFRKLIELKRKGVLDFVPSPKAKDESSNKSESDFEPPTASIALKPLQKKPVKSGRVENGGDVSEVKKCKATTAKSIAEKAPACETEVEISGLYFGLLLAICISIWELTGCIYIDIESH